MRSENSLIKKTAKVVTPFVLSILTILILLQFHLTLTINILITLSVFIISGMVIIFTEIQNTKNLIIKAGYADFSYPLLWRRYKRWRFKSKDFEEFYEWQYLFFESNESFKISEMIYDNEKEMGINLSEPAKNLIIIPILEQFQITKEIDYEETKKSVTRLMQTIKQEPIETVITNNKKHTSQSVIKSFWKNFCNIPPFCTKRIKLKKLKRSK